jgi:hypothetical protein
MDFNPTPHCFKTITKATKVSQLQAACGNGKYPFVFVMRDDKEQFYLVFPADHTFPAILLLFLQILNKTQL